MNQFNEYNTEGYTSEQLVELNAQYDAATVGITDDQELQHIAERLTQRFDTALTA